MKIKDLTILVTENCNYKCSYCYQWKKQNKDLDPLIAKKAVDYSLKNSNHELNITFSGGEPLLNFNLINKCVFYINNSSKISEKKINYSIITNGSLINGDILKFLDDNRFDVQFSFDVYLKDDSSEYNKFINGYNTLKKLLALENIFLSTNTVFTPEKADSIFNSVNILYKEGVKNIGIGIDQTAYWDNKSIKIFGNELKKIKELVLKEYIKTGNIFTDFFNLTESPRINMCGAGGDKLVVTPDGGLWGCSAFYYYDWENSVEKKKDYYYGKVDNFNGKDFETKSKKIRVNHGKFKTDNFITNNEKCFLCDYLTECRLCPAQKYSFLNGTRSMFRIPDQVCRMNKIIFRLNSEFKKDVKGITSL